MKSYFSPKDIHNIVGISYRQIQYWDKTNFIMPSYRRRGRYRLYTFTDLMQLQLAYDLKTKEKMSIQQLRKTMKSLRYLLPQVQHPSTELTVLINDEKIMIFNGDVLCNRQASDSYYRFNAGRLREKVEEMYPEIPPAAVGTGTYGMQRNYKMIPKNLTQEFKHKTVHIGGSSSHKISGSSIDDTVEKAVQQYIL